jgi:hypothetical protein
LKGSLKDISVSSEAPRLRGALKVKASPYFTFSHLNAGIFEMSVQLPVQLLQPPHKLVAMDVRGLDVQEARLNLHPFTILMATAPVSNAIAECPSPPAFFCMFGDGAHCHPKLKWGLLPRGSSISGYDSSLGSFGEGLLWLRGLHTSLNNQTV